MGPQRLEVTHAANAHHPEVKMAKQLIDMAFTYFSGSEVQRYELRETKRE